VFRSSQRERRSMAASQTANRVKRKRICNALQHHTATHCSTLQHAATHLLVLTTPTPHYTTLQHTATHCNKLQHSCFSFQPPPQLDLSKHTTHLPFFFFGPWNEAELYFDRLFHSECCEIDNQKLLNVSLTWERIFKYVPLTCVIHTVTYAPFTCSDLQTGDEIFAYNYSNAIHELKMHNVCPFHLFWDQAKLDFYRKFPVQCCNNTIRGKVVKYQTCLMCIFNSCIALL